MIANDIFIKSLKGVGDVSLKFSPDKKIRVLTGPNGIGKTKTLESIFQVLFFSNETVASVSGLNMSTDVLLFSSVVFQERTIDAPTSRMSVRQWQSNSEGFVTHNLPVLYMGSQQRGLINAQSSKTDPIGAFNKRRSQYIVSVAHAMRGGFATLGMDTAIENWFSTRANSANPYQKSDDNRGFEIETVLRILHQIDSRIDPNFIEINGDGRVFISVEKVKRDLTQLSSGFSSILKITQAIVSGYGSFTNDLNIEKVKGYVLIDEIDSHLHVAWQSGIVQLLSDIFSNTTFFVTTHSPLACIGLRRGEVYQLQRDETGVVCSEEVSSPKNAMLIDIIKDGFGTDLNRNKLEMLDSQSTVNAKNELLKLIRK